MNLPPWKDSDRPELASEWVIEEPAAGKFLARSESDSRVLSGAVLAALLPRIDGRRNVGQLVREAQPNMRAKVRATLELLEEHGLITRVHAGNEVRAEAAYWRLTGSDASEVAERRKSAACRIVIPKGVPDGESRKPMEEALASLGVQVTDDAAFRVMVVRDYRDERLDAINRECFAEGVAWMLVRPYGRRHWIGPLFVPGKTGCWRCLAWWLTINGWTASAVVAEIPALTATTLRLAAMEAARWLLTGKNETIEGWMREFDSGSLEFTNHILLPRPGCPVCGTLDRATVELRSLVSPLTGVAAQMETIREWPGLVVSTAEGSQKAGIDGSGCGYYCSPQTTFGVAEMASGAATVCLAEAVERFSVRYQGTEPIVTASFRQLGERAVDPASLLLPDGVDDPDEVTGWVEATSLISGERLYVPAGHVYLGYDPRYEASTNGCAAGVTLESATIAALIELIERDAVAMWWYNRAPRLAVDMDAVGSRRIEAVLSAARECGVRVHVLDLTTDFGVPVCVAVGVRDAPGIVLGCAAHTSPERCVWKSLAGMSAVMARLMAPLPGRHQWLEDARMEDYPWLMAASGQEPPERRLQPGLAAPRLGASGLFGTELADLLERVRGMGLDVLRVDLTRPELGTPVVRVVVPGLRSFARQLAPGRLYEVPVKLGWIPQALTAEQMNPMPFAL